MPLPFAVPRRRLPVVAAGLLLAIAAVAGAFIAVRARGPAQIFVEYRMSDPQAAPRAIAAGRDGTVWFTLDHADAIGRVRNGVVERLPTGRNNDPLGVAVAPDGSAWFTDIPGRAVARVSSDGAVSRIPLDTAIVRLARLAVAPDGAVWFAEETADSVTRLKDGKFVRHRPEGRRGGPYGVAVASDGTVWATLQSANQLMRIAPDGATASFDLPRPGVLPTDVAVSPDGAVWFVEFRGNGIGRFKDGTFSEVTAGKENAGLSGLAVAPDGAVWFGMIRSSRLGRLRDGRIETFALPRASARPYSVAVDPAGNIWYADISGWVGMLPARFAGQ
jgi:virginiamycin B lyase